MPEDGAQLSKLDEKLFLFPHVVASHHPTIPFARFRTSQREKVTAGSSHDAKRVFGRTAPDARRKTVALEECVSKWSGPVDHILIEKGVCETQDYERVRAAGFVFAAEEPDTQPLYRCYSDAEKSRFASNRDDCARMGRREALLGYVLKN